MISDLKLGFRMLRYGHGVKSNLIGGTLMLIAGVIMQTFSILSNGVVPNSSGVILLIGAMFPIQIIYSLSVSNLIQVSPAKKRMQTSVPAVMLGCCMLAIYLIHILNSAIITAVQPQKLQYTCNQTVELAFFAACMMCYLAVCYKYFFVSVIMFIAVYSYTLYSTTHSMTLLSVFRGNRTSLLLAAVTGIVIIIAGGFLQYGLSCLVYKAPMSKMAQGNMLRKTM